VAAPALALENPREVLGHLRRGLLKRCDHISDSCGAAGRASSNKEICMAVFRDRPYAHFNFLVDLGDGNSEGPQAGFAEVSGIGTEIAVAEYRNGNSKENSVMKITGLNKATDVTLKRGIIGSLNLYQWLNEIRNGDQNALRTVRIHLQSEDHTQIIQSWTLLRARIIKHTSGPFNAKGTDVAMEEIVLAYERLEME
jgi:phage tail-like protein